MSLVRNLSLIWGLGGIAATAACGTETPGGGGTGGAANGSGGAPNTGGIATTGGAVTTGGRQATTGGQPASGGAAVTGGTASGGVATGGKATGGTATGGKATGGTATGGTPSSCPLDLVGFATVSGTTTGGGNVTPTTVTTQAELRACATATTPRVCRVRGTLTFSPFEEIKVQSDKTIIGIGSTAEIVMGGFFVGSGIHNVIIRNLTLRDSYVEGQYVDGGDNGGDRDGVQLDTADHVWIDHCHFNHLGDGQIDSRMDTTYETVSWNIFENHNKTFGIGWTDNVTAQMTIHHNWIRNTQQRNPSTDNVLRAHLYNNFLQNVTSLRELRAGRHEHGATEQRVRHRQRPPLLRHRHPGRPGQHLPQHAPDNRNRRVRPSRSSTPALTTPTRWIRRIRSRPSWRAVPARDRSSGSSACR